jgi:hypothetical protein
MAEKKGERRNTEISDAGGKNAYGFIQDTDCGATKTI